MTLEERRHEMHMRTGWGIVSMALPKNLPEVRGLAEAGLMYPGHTQLHCKRLMAWAPTEAEALDELEKMIEKMEADDE